MTNNEPSAACPEHASPSGVYCDTATTFSCRACLAEFRADVSAELEEGHHRNRGWCFEVQTCSLPYVRETDSYRCGDCGQTITAAQIEDAYERHLREQADDYDGGSESRCGR